MHPISDSSGGEESSASLPKHLQSRAKGRGLASGMGAAIHCPRAFRGLGVVHKPNPPVSQPLPSLVAGWPDLWTRKV